MLQDTLEWALETDWGEEAAFALIAGEVVPCPQLALAIQGGKGSSSSSSSSSSSVQDGSEVSERLEQVLEQLKQAALEANVQMSK
jgi:hypothetical protein